MERTCRQGAVRPLTLGIAAAMLLAACGTETESEPLRNVQVGDSGGWTVRVNGGATLAHAGGGETASIRLICPGNGRFRLNVPAFRPIGSEERMTFGQGASVVTLVADPAGDSKLGGVTAEGPVPERLEALLSGRVAANYGSQNSGPHPPIPSGVLSQFVANCRPAGEKPAAADPKESEVGACFIKDGKRVPDMALRAIGTEPFWAADIRGRCVTYKTPENQEGKRIWTEFDGSRDSGVWTGYYQNKRFILRTRPDRDCSDGMSDKIYPVAVSLVVEGEERTGCADYN